MLEAMIRRKGEAPLGVWFVHQDCRWEGGRLNRGSERVLQGWRVQTPSLSVARRAVCGEAGRPRARVAVAWAGTVGYRGAGPGQGHFPRVAA